MLELRWLWPASALLAVSAGACAGDYPLEPTLCDDVCDVTKGTIDCSVYDPASCVAQCEQGRLTRPVCHAQLEAVLDCFRSKPTAISEQCRYSPLGPLGCQLVTQDLFSCIEADGLSLFE